MASPDLDRLFSPDAIALVGASGDPDKLAGRPYRYLREHGYPGDVYLVNPSRDAIDGEPCYDSVRDVEAAVDLALVLVPAPVVPGVIEECGEADIPFAAVIASGFAETGTDGRDRQDALVAAAEAGGIRVVGPNSEGLVNLHDNVAASFSSILKRDDLHAGGVGFVSQSGAFGGAVFQLLQNAGIGASAWVTTGNEADLDTLDVLRYYVDDPRTDVVAAYVESLRDGRRLLRAGRDAAETDTPIVALRVGATDVGERATAAHTGAIATDDAVYDAMFRAAGVTRVADVDGLAAAVTAFARLDDTTPSAGTGIGVISISGGAAALIADAAERHGAPLADLDASTEAAIRGEIPAYGSASNPVDVTGGAITDPEVFERCLRAVVDDPAVGAVLLQFGNSGDETVEVCKDALVRVRAEGIPVATVFTGSVPREATACELDDVGLLRFEDPVRAVRTLGNVFDWARHRDRVDGTLGAPLDLADRVSLPGDDWTAVTRTLEDFGVPFVASAAATDASDAVAAADRIGYPVAVKLDPLHVAHKADVGGVRVGLDDPDAVRDAAAALTAIDPDAGLVVQRTVDGIELVVGIVDDPDFGPILTVGPGGVFVELLDDAFAYGALPVDADAARELLAASRAEALLDGLRGRDPADRDAAARAIAGLSDAYLDLDVATLEVNPLVATPDGAFAVDLLVE